jgi:hypothetical protein
MNKEVKLINAMLEAAAVASVKWPRGLSCQSSWQHSPEPGCG